MNITLACLNEMGLRNRRDLLTFSVDGAVIQETYTANLMLGCCLTTLLSIQQKGTTSPEVFPCWLNVTWAQGWTLSLLMRGERRLLTADIALDSCSFLIVALYVSNDPKCRS